MSDAAPVKALSREEALALTSSMSAGEQFIVRWQLSALGEFRTQLANLMARADENNFERLRLGFPSEARAMEGWLRGGLAQHLRELGLDL